MEQTTVILRLPRMGHTRAAGRLNSKLLATCTSMLSPWTRRARSRETLRRWSIENTWRALKSAGPLVRSVKSIGIIASVCGETIRRTTEAGSAADLDSSMNFPTAGRHLEDSPRAPSKGAPSSKSKESVWLGCVHSDAAEICSGWHAITANRTARVSIMKAYVSRSIGFVSLRECGLDQI